MLALYFLIFFISVNLANLQQIQGNDLRLIEEIGSEGFGIVHRAKWITRDTDAAVKKLHPTDLGKEAM